MALVPTLGCVARARLTPLSALWFFVALLALLPACAGDSGAPADSGALGGGAGATGGVAGATGGGAAGGGVAGGGAGTTGGGSGATGGGATGGGAGATGGGATGGGATGGGATGGGAGATGGGAGATGGGAGMTGGGTGSSVDGGAPQFGVSALGIGGGSTCAVFDGGLLCWGTVNGYSSFPTSSRHEVSGLGAGSGVVSAAAHDNHACAVLQSGAVRCWGRNDYGQLGDGTTTDHAFAVTVQGVGAGATAVSVGFTHSCAIVDGGVKCWGSNSIGELGINSAAPNAVTATAVAAPDAGLALALRCGSFGTCAVFDNNGARSMRCWGFNSKGQLGTGTQLNAALPTAVVGLPPGVGRIAPGYQHTCATVAGGAQCWGWNRLGQLANGTFLTGANDFVLTPGPVSAPASVANLTIEPTALVSGDSHTCAILDGGAWCWGDNQSHQLANTVTGGGASRPVAATGLSSGVLELGAGTFHTCALVAVGARRQLRCWGLNQNGALGQPNLAVVTDVPLDVPGF